MIATSKGGGACELKRKLTAKGVPEESIGLIHSKAYDPGRAQKWEDAHDPSVLKQPGRSGLMEYASLPKTTDNESRPFLLVTHSRVQSRRTKPRLAQHVQRLSSHSRVLDESLWAAQGHSISKREIDPALAWLESWATPEGGSLKQAYAYLVECAQGLTEELDSQKYCRRWPHLVDLPALSRFELDRYRPAPGTTGRSGLGVFWLTPRVFAHPEIVTSLWFAR